MVTGIGSSAYGADIRSPAPATSDSTSVASLQGRIQQEKIQLDDWTTCVSSKTTKGQAEIQKLSGEISAAKEQVARALQGQSQSPAPASSTSVTRPQGAGLASSGASTGHHSHSGHVDVWA
jgi:hypothetical protein